MTTEAPVWVYYENIATKEQLQTPVRLDGHIGAQYLIETPDIADFTYVDNSGNLTGVFGNLPQALHIYYRPATWRAVHRVMMYIKVNFDVIAFSEPEDNAEPAATLTTGTYWATSLRAISANGQFWYQIGDHAWLPYNDSQMILSDTAPTAENINYINDQAIENNQPNALVNFLPGQSTEVFSEPYGIPVGSVLDGDFVAIAKEEHHDNGIVWYKLADLGWINSLYIDKL